jgi:hypothetical protein
MNRRIRVVQIPCDVLWIAVAAMLVPLGSLWAQDDRGTPSVSVLRGYSEAVQSQHGDAAARSRAQSYLRLTQSRTWTYTDRGQTKRYVGVFAAIVERGGKECVMFTGRAFVPVELLSPADQQAVRQIEDLGSAVRNDHVAMQQEIARQEAAQRAEEERLRKEQAEREERERQARLIPRVVVVRNTVVVESSETGRGRTRRVFRNEEFDVLGDLGGRLEWPASRVSSTAKTSKRLRPAIRARSPTRCGGRRSIGPGVRCRRCRHRYFTAGSSLTAAWASSRRSTEAALPNEPASNPGTNY